MGEKLNEPGGLRKSLVGSVAILAAAIAIAWIDSRPTWDDAGVTALLLFLIASGGTLTGVAWWVAAILAGGPIVLWEIWQGPAVLIVVPVVTAGAVAGTFLRRWGKRR